ncbi:cytidine deaminase [Candidatus Bipolaricaulota bacterium]|nr:cytidine deaminase [Candidatus Bipolaricaulota bacterium]
MSEDKRLIQLALESRDKAYAPYSEFPVGAALLTEEGETYTGVNVENGVNDLSICAERVALFKAISEGERKFTKLAVVCEGEYCQPCGACRQTLFEHAPNLTVLMGNLKEEYRTVQLAELLPEAFQLE